ncbi:leucine-rich repeat and WD repeat-containing protein 1-like [Amphiura filiformis]|uniref:leucine-rich repeat and WD repeat-containing protein 1-like n=1 Tax=Amphiura filiformis TaxID=82378 RepID=UPI003B218BD6
MQTSPGGRIGSSTMLVEKLVLGCAGAISLQDIKRLDLSRRKISTLDPFVFSKMHELEELDLSGNRVSGFPINLGLRKLRTLNCNKNAFKSVLTFEQFPSLEELYIEDNELGAPDQYIAVYMLPKLTKLNGKDVDIRDTIKTMEDILQARLDTIWKESFAQRVKGRIKEDEERSLENEFIEDLKAKVTYGPPSLVEFTHHMLTVLAEKQITQETAGLRTNELLTVTPMFRKVVNMAEVEEPEPPAPKPKATVKMIVGPKKNPTASPSGKPQVKVAQVKKVTEKREGSEEANGEVPRQRKPKQMVKTARRNCLRKAKKRRNLHHLQRAEVAQKDQQTKQRLTEVEKDSCSEEASSSSNHSSINNRHANTKGWKEKLEQEEHEATEAVKLKPKKAVVPKAEKKEVTPKISLKGVKPEGYEPIHMLRCHSIENDPTDAKTNVWKCQFEPDPENPSLSKSNVATCGGNTICVIDCTSGKVIKKYQHDREKEEFYCVAWTTLEINNGEQTQKVNVLAAAGTRGSIKLLHTDQLMCYAEIKGERKARPINSLQFHPTEPTWLFCGSEEIVLWDIGTPEGPDLKCKCKKLLRFQAPGRLLGIVVPPSGDFVLAGCENGCYGWNIDVKNAKKDRRHHVEFLLPSKARLAEAIKGEDESDEEAEGDMIDGLALTSDNQIASKVACDGSIHLWDIEEARKGKPNTRKELKVTPDCTLEWCNSDSVYLDIGAWRGGSMLVSGDDQGKIWVYDITKLPSKNANKPPTQKATYVLNWPEDQTEDNSSDSSANDLIINDVAVSSDSNYIVSVTNKNVVCIWQIL